MNVTELIDLSEGRVVLVDKPLRMTSFGAVNRIKHRILNELTKDVSDPQEKRRLKKRLKVGHAGTLDPLATGLLIICTGKKTKTIQDIQSQEKEYTGTIMLGAVTMTFDLESSPEEFADTRHITPEDVAKAVDPLTGVIFQYPPIHSAVKVDGKRAYELARAGHEFVTRPKQVEIKVFDVDCSKLPEVSFRVVCSKGTYIRSLANDLGRNLKCGGYLSSLRRTRIGEYRVEDAEKLI